MPTSISTNAFDQSTATARKKNALRQWLREPLLHFIVLGGVLFGVDHFIAGRADDPNTIVVGPEVNSEAIHVFEETRGRHPNEKELTALHRIWLDNEVLYREGLAMQLDKGDTAIRERVIFKALSVVDANVKLPAIDDQQLREWFERHRDKYDDPARYNFEEAVLAGDNSEAAIRSFVATLNGGAPGDVGAGLRVFKDRPHANLVQSYGAEFAKALDAATPGTWQALQAGGSWHAIRLDAIAAPQPANYEQLRGVVMQDWTDATAAEQRTAAVRALAKKYNVIFPDPAAHGTH